MASRLRQYCQNGHSLVAGNIYVTPDKRRQCITCKRARDHAAYLRTKNRMKATKDARSHGGGVTFDERRALFEMVADKYVLPPVCPKCKYRGEFSALSSRPSLACNHCGYHLSPLGETKLFRKTRTPLKDWKLAYQLMRYDANVTTAAIQAITGMTYKTAWRIRKLLKENPDEAEYYLADG